MNAPQLTKFAVTGPSFDMSPQRRKDFNIHRVENLVHKGEHGTVTIANNGFCRTLTITAKDVVIENVQPGTVVRW